MKSAVFTPDICIVSLIFCDIPKVFLSYFFPPTIVLAHTLRTIFISQKGTEKWTGSPTSIQVI